MCDLFLLWKIKDVSDAPPIHISLCLTEEMSRLRYDFGALLRTAVRPASTLKNAVILAATLFSGARVYYALR